MRLFLFAGEGYYPRGGLEDYVGSYDHIEELYEGLRNKEKEEVDRKYGSFASEDASVLDWAEAVIFNGKDLQRVATWRKETGWENMP